MDSNFFFSVTIHQDGVSVVNVATWVQQLPIAPSLTSAVATLVSTEGVQPQGMYLYDTNMFRWRYLVPYANVCQAIIDGSTIDLYYQVETPVTPPADSLIWRNGVLYSGDQIDTTPSVAWAVLTAPAAGDVSSVNGVTPDTNGNVAIGISNIPGLQTALNNAGTVKTVNSQTPDVSGNIVLTAEDNNDASGTSLIVDGGATDGTFKFKTLVAGANVTLSADANGNIEIAATGGGGGSGVTSVALSMPSIFSVSGSPVTSTGTLTAVLASQNANTFFRGPNSGSANIPTFGPLVATDLPLATTSQPGAVLVSSGLSVAAGVLTANVLSVAGRTGNVVLAVGDVSGAAPLASPALTGVPTAPTAAPGNNTTQLATTAFVQAAVTGFDLQPATATTLGGVIVPNGGGLTINGSGDLSANVLTVAGRTGNVVLAVADVSGAAPLASPALTGTPTAPTASPGTNTTQIATTAFVEAAVTAGSVTSFNTRTGAVTLVATDLQVGGNGAFILGSPQFTGVPTAPTAGAGSNTTQLATTSFVTGAVTGLAPLASPTFTGIPAGPTASPGTNTTQFATTAFVTAAVAASGVTTFNGRSGAVTFVATDMQVGGTGAFILGSPQFTGVPIAPTATAGTNTTQLATTAFVVTALSPYALLASPALTGVPTAPTASPGTDTTQIATTAFVQAAVTGFDLPVATTTTLGGVIVGSGLGVTVGGTLSANVATVNGQTGAVVLAVANISGAAPLASPALTGTPTAPTGTQGDATTQIATDAFVQNAISGTDTITLSSVSFALSAAQYSVPIITLNGNVSVPVTITFPTTGRWTVINNSTGLAVTLVAGNGSGTTLAPIQGATYDVVASGNSLLPAGEQGLTRPLNDDTGYLATTAFVANAIGALSSGVTSFNSRTGAVTLVATDLQVGGVGSGAFILGSPAFTGVPTAPTATAGTTTTQIATTQFVAASYAPLASPALTGVPTAPTATFGTNTTQIATTAYVTGSYAPLASPALSGTPTAPTAAQGTNSTQVATTAFIQTYLGATVSVPLASTTPVTLSAAQYSSEIIEFVGALTQSIVVDVPTSGQWIMYNKTSGAFNVTLSNGSGATFALPQNQSATVVSLTTLGVINANTAGNVLTPATVSTLGGVIVPNGGGITVDASGNIGVTAATGSTLGGVIVGAGLSVSAGTVSANVQTVAGVSPTSGNVPLAVANITGAAPLASPTFTGVPAAPTATAGTSTTQVATTAFVANAIGNGTVITVAAATGITLSAAQYANSDIYILTTGSGSPPTIEFPAAAGTQVWNVTLLAGSTVQADLVGASGNTGSAFVALSTGATTSALVTPDGANGLIKYTGASGAVSSVFGRTGAVVATSGDYTVAQVTGAAPIASPTFTGTPAAPTATAGTSTTQLATTAFVATSFAPLASPTFTGRAQSPAYSYSVSALGSVSGNPVTINLGTAAEFTMTITGATTFAFTNTLGANIGEVIYMRITNGGAFAVTWPTGALFAGGTAPALTASGIDLIGVRYDVTASVYTVFTIGLNLLT